MGLNLSMNLPMFVCTFQAMWRHRPLKEYSVFFWILFVCTSFSPYTLVGTSLFSSHVNSPVLQVRWLWLQPRERAAGSSAQVVPQDDERCSREAYHRHPPHVGSAERPADQWAGQFTQNMSPLLRDLRTSEQVSAPTTCRLCWGTCGPVSRSVYTTHIASVKGPADQWAGQCTQHMSSLLRDLRTSERVSASTTCPLCWDTCWPVSRSVHPAHVGSAVHPPPLSALLHSPVSPLCWETCGLVSRSVRRDLRTGEQVSIQVWIIAIDLQYSFKCHRAQRDAKYTSETIK